MIAVTTTFYTAPTNDATFTAMGKLLSDLFTAVGFIKSADTGQVDWNTTIANPAVGSWVNYEIRRFNDSLQSACPIFMRIDYGYSGNNSNNFGQPYSLQISIGTGSNGAGTLTGVVLSNFAIVSPQSGRSLFASGGEGWFSFLPGYVPSFNSTNAPNNGCINIERTRDAAGNYTATGFTIVVFTGSGSGYTRFQHYFKVGGGAFYPVSQTQRILTPYPGAGVTTATYGNRMGFFPMMHDNYGAPGLPTCGVVFCVRADFPATLDAYIPVTLPLLTKQIQFWFFVSGTAQPGPNAGPNFAMGVHME
jgi:hypothetical protein